MGDGRGRQRYAGCRAGWLGPRDFQRVALQQRKRLGCPARRPVHRGPCLQQHRSDLDRDQWERQSNADDRCGWHHDQSRRRPCDLRHERQQLPRSLFTVRLANMAQQFSESGGLYGAQHPDLGGEYVDPRRVLGLELQCEYRDGGGSGFDRQKRLWCGHVFRDELDDWPLRAQCRPRTSSRGRNDRSRAGSGNAGLERRGPFSYGHDRADYLQQLRRGRQRDVGRPGRQRHAHVLRRWHTDGQSHADDSQQRRPRRRDRRRRRRLRFHERGGRHTDPQRGQHIRREHDRQCGHTLPSCRELVAGMERCRSFHRGARCNPGRVQQCQRIRHHDHAGDGKFCGRLAAGPRHGSRQPHLRLRHHRGTGNRETRRQLAGTHRQQHIQRRPRRASGQRDAGLGERRRHRPRDHLDRSSSFERRVLRDFRRRHHDAGRYGDVWRYGRNDADSERRGQ